MRSGALDGVSPNSDSPARGENFRELLRWWALLPAVILANWLVHWFRLLGLFLIELWFLPDAQPFTQQVTLLSAFWLGCALAGWLTVKVATRVAPRENVTVAVAIAGFAVFVFATSLPFDFGQYHFDVSLAFGLFGFGAGISAWEYFRGRRKGRANSPARGGNSRELLRWWALFPAVLLANWLVHGLRLLVLFLIDLWFLLDAQLFTQQVTILSTFWLGSALAGWLSVKVATRVAPRKNGTVAVALSGFAISVFAISLPSAFGQHHFDVSFAFGLFGFGASMSAWRYFRGRKRALARER